MKKIVYFLILLFIVACSEQDPVSENCNGNNLVKYMVLTCRNVKVQFREPNSSQLYDATQVDNIIEDTFNNICSGKVCEIIVKSRNDYDVTAYTARIYINGVKKVDVTIWEQAFEHETRRFQVNTQ